MLLQTQKKTSKYLNQEKTFDYVFFNNDLFVNSKILEMVRENINTLSFKTEDSWGREEQLSIYKSKLPWDAKTRGKEFFAGINSYSVPFYTSAIHLHGQFEKKTKIIIWNEEDLPSEIIKAICHKKIQEYTLKSSLSLKHTKGIINSISLDIKLYDANSKLLKEERLQPHSNIDFDFLPNCSKIPEYFVEYNIKYKDLSITFAEKD